MIYILMLLALLNGLLSIGVIILLHLDPVEINRTSVGAASFFFVNAWFFGVAAYLV